jgi:hypothetical protein
MNRVIEITDETIKGMSTKSNRVFKNAGAWKQANKTV